MKRWTLERTPRAEDDLLDIWAYVAAENPDAADRLVRALSEQFRKTSDFPELGQSVDWLVPGHRILTRGSYVLIYRILTARHAVELVRVVHSARNWPALFDA
ncbi:MAG: type II toxin-antitoxin system RelE/ParE family toxin [Pseudomonadota bacterium]